MATVQQTIQLAQPAVSVDQHKLMLKRLFFATFWLLVFTGAVRKWIAPNTTALYLLQDVPITLAYLYALVYGLVELSPLFLSIALLAAVLAAQAFYQMVAVGLPPLVAVIGLHHYFYYLPMLLVFPAVLDAEARKAFARWNTWLAVPMSVLVVAQATLPPSAIVNRTTLGDAMSLPGSDTGRVSGTYNFVGFYSLWVVLASSVIMGEWFKPKHERVASTPLLAAATAAMAICALISGSRDVIVLYALTLVGIGIESAMSGPSRALVLFGSLAVLVPVVWYGTAIVVPKQHEVMLQRFSTDEIKNTEGDRLTSIAYGYLTQPPISLTGMGIGIGVDAAHVGDANGYSLTYMLSEYDTVRIVYECGTLVGLLYDGARFLLAFSLIPIAFWLAREKVDFAALPLAIAFAGQSYGNDWTRNGTMTITQVMVGYCLILGAWRQRNEALASLPAPSGYSTYLHEA